MNHPSEEKDLATFGGGCFWCTEAVFDLVRGVLSIIPGYAGGETVNPTYEQVSTGTTGHAEVVQITFNPTAISYRELLEIFFATHDPTTLNRQGPDVGTQYRSVVFYHNQTQKQALEQYIRELTDTNQFKNPIVTQVKPFKVFYLAEEYHREYFKKHPTQGYCRVNISPKIAKVRKYFQTKLVA